MNITIIGTGNAATVLGKLFIRNSHCIKQIIGRNETAAKELSDTLKCPYSLTLKELNQHSDIYILSVSDKAVGEIVRQISVPENGIIAHTAGGVSINVFKNYFNNYGVLYPLQSLRKENKNIPPIPFFVDANKDDAKNKLFQFAKTLSSPVNFADDQQRLKLHIAAVFTSNFPNFLYAAAKNFCDKEQLGFENLLPLILETANRLQNYNPSEMQTGPAFRRDKDTLDKHLAVLKKYETEQNVYRFLSDEIQKYFQLHL